MKWFKDLSINVKFLVSFGVLFLILIAIVMSAISNIKYLQKNQVYVYNTNFTDFIDISNYRKNLDKQVLDINKVTSENDPTLINNLDKAIKDISTDNRVIIEKLSVRNQNNPEFSERILSKL